MVAYKARVPIRKNSPIQSRDSPNFSKTANSTMKATTPTLYQLTKPCSSRVKACCADALAEAPASGREDISAGPGRNHVHDRAFP